MACHVPYDMPTFVEISRTAYRLFARINSSTRATESSFLLVESQSDLGPSSTEFRPGIVAHSNMRARFKNQSPTAVFNVSKVSAKFLQSLTQNLMKTLCFCTSDILIAARNATRRRNTCYFDRSRRSRV
jgi:hypothetical protein